ncbi:hypothetical protein PR003_g18119 [Phytophthora rubi]|uniref:RxLR effector protein n=1 Tax=Phytophthora rubi TaxID=129364 RepID=A0A6A3K739_9STRA|nr:hypothetical protein PR002_g17683 [Phytophthora rubi]KAE9006364.1 hypothetical protein PR001_g17224 [Phytophthora rubi]KAE9318894.1 hypothetical protein PR003_g18119 [Phytophthora rubi]
MREVLINIPSLALFQCAILNLTAASWATRKPALPPCSTSASRKRGWWCVSSTMA